jgi:oligosaccharide repeat unit polymerase
MLPFVYLAPMLGGLLLGEVRTRVRLFSLLGLLPGLLITITQTAKAASLISGLLWVAGYCASETRRQRWHLFTWRRIGWGLAALIPITGFLYFVTLSRQGALDPALLELASRKLRVSAIGHMTVFSDWFSEYLRSTTQPTLGRYTFAGPAEALGLGNRIGGLFETTYFLSFGESSNIYTAFRPLIEDFTLPGALAFLLLLGFGAGLGFRAVSRGGWWAVPLLLTFYAVTLWSPITWLLLYNSELAAVAALALVILLTPRLPGRWPRRLRRFAPANTVLTNPHSEA